jgi:AcrR family transcriptional regulator
MKTKDRILLGALELFNTDGATEVTTNDISRQLKMSPGNLYFHFKNKEQIVREIFKKMATETITVWKPQTKLAQQKQKIQLIDFIDKNLSLYWKYRFFHREMYILRKKDPDLSKLWHKHLKRTSLLMIILYKHWVKSGHMVPIQSKGEMEFLGELLFVASNSFMQFFETADRGSAPNADALFK